MTRPRLEEVFSLNEMVFAHGQFRIAGGIFFFRLFFCFFFFACPLSLRRQTLSSSTTVNCHGRVFQLKKKPAVDPANFFLLWDGPKKIGLRGSARLPADPMNRQALHLLSYYFLLSTYYLFGTPLGFGSQCRRQPTIVHFENCNHSYTSRPPCFAPDSTLHCNSHRFFFPPSSPNVDCKPANFVNVRWMDKTPSAKPVAPLTPPSATIAPRT